MSNIAHVHGQPQWVCQHSGRLTHWRVSPEEFPPISGQPWDTYASWGCVMAAAGQLKKTDLRAWLGALADLHPDWTELPRAAPPHTFLQRFRGKLTDTEFSAAFEEGTQGFGKHENVREWWLGFHASRVRAELDRPDIRFYTVPIDASANVLWTDTRCDFASVMRTVRAVLTGPLERAAHTHVRMRENDDFVVFDEGEGLPHFNERARVACKLECVGDAIIIPKTDRGETVAQLSFLSYKQDERK